VAKKAKRTTKKKKKQVASKKGKRSGGKAGSSPPVEAPLEPNPSTVCVRMYRQGLGDCFLLAFPGSNGPTYMLIDCGVFMGTKNAAKRMTAVVENIKAATNGRVDVLVVTHEHWDHVSGFGQAKEIFKKIKVGQLWLAWTEDPANQLADVLRKERAMRLNALKLAVGRLRLSRRVTAENTNKLLGFFGVDALKATEAAALGAKGGGATGAAFDTAKSLTTRVKYCYPDKKAPEVPGVSGARVFVLGPPEKRELLLKSDPSKKDSEVYELAGGLGFEMGFLAALPFAVDSGARVRTEDRERFDRSHPFEERYRVKPGTAETIDKGFFATYYGVGESTKRNTEKWRRIDDDWLGYAGALALKLDSDTNNTSLALAIELTPGGKVLLFPGDAQVGNWLSWHERSWRTDDGKRIDIKDLLARTVFYKVGHHGSHNATLREKGLELMSDSELAAMIPVEKEMVDKKKWKMPFEPLHKRLEEKTRGRMIRADVEWPQSKSAKPKGLSRAEWNAFKANVRYDETNKKKPLYVDFTISTTPRGGN